MSLVVLKYHRARTGADGNPAEMLDAHFRLIAEHCSNVLPGEQIEAGKLNVCLSFNGGYYDFYVVVLPLLKRHGLRALLAVPPWVLREQVTATSIERLALDSDYAAAHPKAGGFCTWPELETVAASGHVTIAANGYTHRRLDDRETDLSMEIHAPQTVLGSRLGQAIDSFAFPYGRFSRRSLGEARVRYRHVFAGGEASNPGWNSRVSYCVRADAMPGPASLFTPGRLALYRARRYLNRLLLR